VSDSTELVSSVFKENVQEIELEIICKKICQRKLEGMGDLKFGRVCTESYSERGVTGEYVFRFYFLKRIRDSSNENSKFEVQIVIGGPG